jgi:iron complex transport system permease protein
MSALQTLARLRWISAIAGATILVMGLVALKFGVVDLSWEQLWQGLVHADNSQVHHALLWEIRIPRILTSVLGSALLALSGLLMQNIFRNPLAGPSILGITSGSSLGVALITMAATAFGWPLNHFVQHGAVPLAAFCGAFAVLLLVLFVSRRMSDHQSLLIFGVMLGYFTSALITTLQYKANADNIRTYVLWGMGSFAETDFYSLALLALSLLVTYLFIYKKRMALTTYLLGDAYALTMGYDVVRLRRQMIGICGLQVGLVTAFCGPIAFIGLTVPILVRLFLGNSDYRYNLPLVVLIGGMVGILSDQISIWAALPLNAVTASLGAPMILWLLFQSRTSSLTL